MSKLDAEGNKSKLPGLSDVGALVEVLNKH